MHTRFADVLTLLGFIALAAASGAIASASGGRFSAAVLGLVVLLLLLVMRRRVDAPVERVADRLLQWFPLLFVPATTGIVVYLPMLRASWLGVSVALCVSTLLGVTVGAWTARAIARRHARA